MAELSVRQWIRLLIFITIITGILGGLSALVGNFYRLLGVVPGTAVGLMVWGLGLSYIVGELASRMFGSTFLIRFGRIGLGVFSVVLLVTLGGYTGYWAGVPKDVLFTGSWTAIAGLSLVGLLNGKRTPVVRTIAVQHAKLVVIGQPKRIVQLSDLHLDGLKSTRWLENVVQQTMALAPNMVVITGDLLDAPPIKLRAYIPILQQLRPPGGVFVVSGNHDFYSGPFEFQAYIRQAGFQLVDNDIVTVDGIQIAGLPDETAGQFGYPIDTLETLLQRLSPELPAILLRHQPVEIEKAADHGAIILKLSGHTHNGQMVPWNWVVRIRYGKFTYGLNKVKDMFAYTTNGTSTWGPPFRLFKPCEIVAFELS